MTSTQSVTQSCWFSRVRVHASSHSLWVSNQWLIIHSGSCPLLWLTDSFPTHASGSTWDPFPNIPATLPCFKDLSSWPSHPPACWPVYVCVCGGGVRRGADIRTQCENHYLHKPSQPTWFPQYSLIFLLLSWDVGSLPTTPHTLLTFPPLLFSPSILLLNSPLPSQPPIQYSISIDFKVTLFFEL